MDKKEGEGLSKEIKILITICILFTIFWIFLFIYTDTQWAQDSHWHMKLATNSFEGKGYTLDGVNPHGKYTPGLTILLFPFLYLGNVQVAGLFLLYILSILSIVLTYKIGSFVNKEIGLIAGALLAFHNLFLFNSTSIMTETPFMFFSLAAIYFFIQSYKKEIFIIPSLVFAALSILIRYDGFFLLVPFLFLILFNKVSEIKRILFSWKGALAIISGIAIAAPWFIRNYRVFGSFFYSDYTQEAAAVTIKEAIGFFGLFFKLGYLLPILAIVGLCILLFSIKDKRINALILWFFAYLLLHAFWWARPLRFYVEVLALICFFAAVVIYFIATKIINNKEKQKYFMLLAVLVIASLQLFIFFSGNLNNESTIDTINRYTPIRDASVWANNNENNTAVFIVSDYAVYSLYLNKPNIIGYQQGIQSVAQNPSLDYFLFVDNLHPWITKQFYGLNTFQVAFKTQDGGTITKTFKMEELKSFYYGKDSYNKGVPWETKIYKLTTTN